jgi:hypothetical protein
LLKNRAFFTPLGMSLQIHVGSASITQTLTAFTAQKPHGQIQQDLLSENGIQL